MVHSDRTVVVLLHRHFSSWLTTFCNSVSIVTNCTYITMSESNIMDYVNNSFTFFMSAFYSYFLFSINCFLPFFHLECTQLCRFMFLTNFGNKSQCCQRGNYVSCMILSPMCKSTHMTDFMQWHHFLLATNTRKVQPGIMYATSHETENYRISFMPNCIKLTIIMLIWRVV